MPHDLTTIAGQIAAREEHARARFTYVLGDAAKWHDKGRSYSLNFLGMKQAYDAAVKQCPAAADAIAALIWDHHHQMVALLNLEKDLKRRSEQDVDAEQTIAVLEERLADAGTSRNHTQQWYAERLERLKDLCKQAGVWDKAASIIANGTVAGEPPTYAQQLNDAKHRAASAEKKLAEFRDLYSTEWGGDGKTDATFCEAFERVYVRQRDDERRIREQREAFWAKHPDE